MAEPNIASIKEGLLDSTLAGMDSLRSERQ